jgi:hypothetical protein
LTADLYQNNIEFRLKCDKPKNIISEKKLTEVKDRLMVVFNKEKIKNNNIENADFLHALCMSFDQEFLMIGNDVDVTAIATSHPDQQQSLSELNPSQKSQPNLTTVTPDNQQASC